MGHRCAASSRLCACSMCTKCQLTGSSRDAGQGVVGLDFGPYREKGVLKLSTDRSEEIGLLLTEYIKLIKTHLDKKKDGSGSAALRRDTIPQLSGLYDEAEAGSADVLPPLRATMRPAGLGSSSTTIASPSTPQRSPTMPMATPASPRGCSVYSPGQTQVRSPALLPARTHSTQRHALIHTVFISRHDSLRWRLSLVTFCRSAHHGIR
jgi:hypothetical protein